CCRGVAVFVFFFQAEDGIRDLTVTGVQTCALPISRFADRNCGKFQSENFPASGANHSSSEIAPSDRFTKMKPSQRPVFTECSERSEERRVGKECRSRWARCQSKKS